MGRELGKEKARKDEKDVKNSRKVRITTQSAMPFGKFWVRKKFLSFFFSFLFPISLFSPKGKFPNPPRFRGLVESNI